MKLRIDEKNGQTRRWSDERSQIVWEFRVDHPGRYAVRVETSGQQPATLAAESAGQSVQHELAATGDNAAFAEHTLGTLMFDAPGVQQLRLSPVPGRWGLTGLRRVRLVPVDR